MTIEQLWREQYRQKRYLAETAIEKVHERMWHLQRLLYGVNHDNKIVVHQPIGNRYSKRYTHCLEEFALRNLSPLDDLPGCQTPCTAYTNADRAAELWKPLNLAPGKFLLKYGEARFLGPLLSGKQRGRFRIAPASLYADPSLNSAVRDDDELTVTQHFRNARVFCPPNGDHSAPREEWYEMPILSAGVTITDSTVGNYYVACFALAYDLSLYDEFGYDSCLVIKDIARFGTCLKEAMSRAAPDYVFRYGPVDYYDPYFPDEIQTVMFRKHFQYAYQKEFRFTWEQHTPQGVRGPVSLELGALEEYCELLVL